MRRDVTRAILLFRSKNRKREVVCRHNDGGMCCEWCVVCPRDESGTNRPCYFDIHGFGRLHSARHQTEKVSLDSCGFHLKTVEPLQSRHTHKKLSTFRPSRKASPSGKKEKRRTLCVCVCGVICPKSFSRHSQQKKPEIPIDEFPDPFPASRLLKIFFGNLRIVVVRPSIFPRF